MGATPGAHSAKYAPGAPRVDLEATQAWTVRRCPSTKNAYGLEIAAYNIVVKHAPGSAQLPPSAPGTENELMTLNERIGEMEQKRDEEAHKFFNSHLSDQLIFRRASGKVVGKSGPEGFLESLNKPNPFTSRRAEDISVTLLDDRALVTLIVAGTRADGSEGRHRNIRLFSKSSNNWILELWYNYEITSL